jgi:hypothetical protein
MAGPMARLELVHEETTMRQWYCRNVQISAWFDAPTLDQMHAYGRAARSLSMRFGGRSALMNVIVGGVPRFTSEVRQAAADYTKEGAHQIGAAHIILVDGLLGSSVRAFLSTMMLLGRPPNPTRVFGDIASASEWMAQHLTEKSPEAWMADELATVCRAAITRDDRP